MMPLFPSHDLVRAAEGGTAVPSDVTTKRAAERAKVVDYADFSG